MGPDKEGLSDVGDGMGVALRGRAGEGVFEQVSEQICF